MLQSLPLKKTILVLSLCMLVLIARRETTKDYGVKVKLKKV